ncbi:MAG: hypothetical protein EAZ14_08415 [Runella slithyformis]|nr:MAG: hypothetical protein EAZ14_08415 [Runella slithyformis]
MANFCSTWRAAFSFSLVWPSDQNGSVARQKLKNAMILMVFASFGMNLFSEQYPVVLAFLPYRNTTTISGFIAVEIERRYRSIVFI